jgi:hypothetical protein
LPFAIDVQPGLIHMTLSGVLTDEDLRGIASAADEIEGASNPIAPRITDMTGVIDLKIDYASVQAFATRRRVIRFPNAFKSAIVVGGPAHLGIARMFQTLNDNPQITVEIFTERATALAWVRS